MASEEQDVIIDVEGIYKTFKLPHERTTSVKSAIVGILKPKRTFESQKVLKDVNFHVNRGEFFGIVGRNGSGKSTLLKLLAGIYAPTNGSIKVGGKLTPFIELGVGFNPELTGRENIFLNGALLGFNRKEMLAMYQDIVQFAELSRFMDQKLKNYSSGMQVRLAFSIAIRAQSDILLIDEVLAVGDAAFQRKCFDHFMLLKKNRQTVILVTHDMGAVRQYCDRAIMIDKGKVVESGSAETIAQAYQKLFTSELKTDEGDQPETSDAKRWGTGKIRAHRASVKQDDKFLTITTAYEAKADVPAPIFGFTIYGPTGKNILEGNTLRQKIKTEDLHKGDEVDITWQVPNIFATGNYEIAVATCDKLAVEYYDWLNEAAKFKVTREGSTAGVVDPPLEIKSFNWSPKHDK